MSNSELLYCNCNMYTESGKVQEVYKLLLPLKSWLAEQEEKMNSMRPAAVLSAPLSDQITKNDVRICTCVICVCTHAAHILTPHMQICMYVCMYVCM